MLDKLVDLGHSSLQAFLGATGDVEVQRRVLKQSVMIRAAGVTAGKRTVGVAMLLLG